MADESTKIFCNGTILTLAGGSLLPVNELVVKGDTITYVGTFDNANEAAGPDAEIMDLN